MKAINVFCGSLAFVVLTATTFAQDADSPDLYQPESIRQVAFEGDDYKHGDPDMRLAQSGSPSDLPPAPAIVVPDDEPIVQDVPLVIGSSCECSCPAKCDRGPLCGIDIGGWVQAGAIINAHGDKTSNGPLGFNDDPHFNMHQTWIYAHRDAQTDGCGVDWGGGIDFVYGADGPDTQAFGDETWDYGWWSGNGVYGSAIPQLYAELAINKMKIKAGHFYTNIGYEVVQAPDNFFFSHAYTMYYGEPFTHTGFIAEYALMDCLTLQGGWVDGWDSGWGNRFGSSMFIGGISADLTEDMSLTWALTTGQQRGASAHQQLYMNSIVFQWEVTEKFTYVLQHDMGNTDIYDQAVTPSNWWGINQYFLYQLCDELAVGMRLEWFRDNNGTRVPPFNAGNYYGLTFGLNWIPCDCVVVRPELRYDSYEGTTGAGAPFNNGRDCTQLSGGLDFIVKF